MRQWSNWIIEIRDKNGEREREKDHIVQWHGMGLMHSIVCPSAWLMTWCGSMNDIFGGGLNSFRYFVAPEPGCFILGNGLLLYFCALGINQSVLVFIVFCWHLSLWFSIMWQSWCTFGALLVHFWCTFGALLVLFWCTFGALLQKTL